MTVGWHPHPSSRSSAAERDRGFGGGEIQGGAAYRRFDPAAPAEAQAPAGVLGGLFHQARARQGGKGFADRTRARSGLGGEVVNCQWSRADV